MELTFDVYDTVAQRERGQRIASDERPSTPALAVLDRLEQTVRPSVSDWCNVSAFIHAIINTSRVAASCTMAATRPSSLYFTVASSTSDAEIGVVAGIASAYAAGLAAPPEIRAGAAMT